MNVNRAIVDDSDRADLWEADRRIAIMRQQIADRPVRAQLETLSTFGARILRYILETEITSVFSDVEIEQALSASILAHCNADLLSTSRQQIADLRYRLSSLLAARKRQEAQGAPIVPSVDEPCAPGGNARVRPLAPPPAPKPVAPRQAVPDINF